jgi:hypothetical protein
MRRVETYKQKYGYVDAWGNMVIPPRWDWADDFDRGLARVGVDVDSFHPGWGTPMGGRWGYVDTDGNWVWKPTN